MALSKAFVVPLLLLVLAAHLVESEETNAVSSFHYKRA